MIADSAVKENPIYVGAPDGHAYVWAFDDASIRWTATTDAPVASMPAVPERWSTC